MQRNWWQLIAIFFQNHYDDAAAAAQRCININSDFTPGLAILAASYACGGQQQAAETTAKRLLTLMPDFTVRKFIRIGRFSPELNEKYSVALHKSGLPE